MEIFYISTLVLVTQKYILITKYTELLILGHSEIYSIQMIPQYSCLLANGKQEQHLQSRTNFEHIFHLSSHCSSSSSFETLRPSGKVITGAQDPLPCAGEKLSSSWKRLICNVMAFPKANMTIDLFLKQQIWSVKILCSCTPIQS